MATTLETLSQDLAGAVERVGRRVVAIRARRRIPSSGIVWRDGLVVTASHTIQREDDITVLLPDGGTARATLLGRDLGSDLAALRLDPSPGGEIEIAPPDALRVGTMVLALGRPGPALTAAFGLISAAGDAWRTWHGGKIDRLIRLDIGIYDGFSGGPLVDAAGRVLGVNTSTLLRGAPTTIPAETVERVLAQLVEHGRVPAGYLGVATETVRLPDQLVKVEKLSERTGLMIVSVESGSPAEQAGMLLGDVLVAIDDTAVADPGDVLAVLDADSVGREANVRVIRAGKTKALTVKIGERVARRAR
jgi:S1-C subfamily serine protease